MLEKTLESPLDCKEIQPVHPKGDQSWVFWSSNTLATSCKEVTHWKRPWCWEGLGAGGEGDNRGWDGWMASPIWWTWVWVNFGSWWWTGRPGVLWFMGSQRVGHDWATELNWTDRSVSANTEAKEHFYTFDYAFILKKALLEERIHITFPEEWPDWKCDWWVSHWGRKALSRNPTDFLIALIYGNQDLKDSGQFYWVTIFTF